MALRTDPGEGAAAPAAETGHDAESRWTEAFLRLVAALVARPRWRDRPLPLIWLSGDPGGGLAGGPAGGAVLGELAGRLAIPGRFRVPHGRLPATADSPADSPARGPESEIRPLLDRLSQKLSRPTFGTGRLWFRRYALAAWLLDQDLSDLRSDDVPFELGRRLRDRSRPRRGPGRTGGSDLSGDGLFGALAVLSWLLSRLVPQVLFRVAVAGRVPGIGRRYRWFMRQHYLAPAQSGTFLAFAERLTAGGKEDEPADQIDKLLVHAFLEDLRHAYLRRPWRIQSRRRTAYPVALIDDVRPGTARHTLLRLINDVRNETGRHDPLLLIGAGERVPPATIAPSATAATPPTLAPVDTHAIQPADLDSAYRTWVNVLPRKRRARGHSAWIWSIDVPAQAVTSASTRTGTGAGRDDDDGGGPASFVPPKPPWFARRTVAVAACLAVAVSVTGLVAIRSGWPRCGHSPLDGSVSVREIGGQCIGLSGGGFLFNDRPGQEPLVAVQRRIFAQNDQIRDTWEHSGRSRPLVTVVYLGTLTGRDAAVLPGEEAYVAEREELEGLAVAQYDGLRTSVPNMPLMRVVVANAGFQMRYASEAVKMIVDLAHHDPTLIGVIGLVESRRTTGAALRMLNAAQIPAISPTLSGDDMSTYSKLYLQISPPNRDQAAMIEHYAREVLHVSRIRVHYTVGERSTLADDLYVNTLLADLNRAFGRRLESLTSYDGRAGLTADCGYRGLVLFAGRWSEFAAFLAQLSASCGDRPPAHLMADDSVNRYMANPVVRAGAPGNIPVTYVSKGALATCGLLGPRTGDAAAARFLGLVRAPDLLSPPRCDPARTGQGAGGEGFGGDGVGERVGLAYDSATIMLRAVQALGVRLRGDQRQRWNPRAITPVGVYTEIGRQNLMRPFPGVTGAIRFDDAGEPVHKVLYLLKVKSIPATGSPPTVVFRCGTAGDGDPATCRRP